MTRMYDPTEGEILLDGVNIKTIDYEQYVSIFSSVFQGYRLFSFSIKDNVAFAQPTLYQMGRHISIKLLISSPAAPYPATSSFRRL